MRRPTHQLVSTNKFVESVTYRSSLDLSDSEQLDSCALSRQSVQFGQAVYSISSDRRRSVVVCLQLAMMITELSSSSSNRRKELRTRGSNSVFGQKALTKTQKSWKPSTIESLSGQRCPNLQRSEQLTG